MNLAVAVLFCKMSKDHRVFKYPKMQLRRCQSPQGSLKTP